MNKKVLFGGIAALLLATAAYVYFTYFSIKDDQIKYLPKNAAIVVKIDASALANKADVGKLMNDPDFKKIMDKMKNVPNVRKSLENPKESGINPVSNFYLAIEYSKEQMASNVFISILDENKAIESFKSYIGKTAKVTEKDGVKYFASSDYGTSSVFAVEGNTAVLSFIKSNNFDYFDYENQEANNLKASEKASQYVLNLFKDKSGTMAKSAVFKAMDNLEGEIKMLYNSKAILEASNLSNGMLKMPSFIEAYKDICSIASIQFNKGEILMTGKSIDQKGNDFKVTKGFMSDKPFSKGFVENYPKSSFNLDMAMKLDMKTVRETASEMIKLYGGAEMSSEIESFLSSLDGELVGGIIDFKKGMYGSALPEFEVIAGINGPSQLQGFLDKYVKSGVLAQNGNVYSMGSGPETVFMGVFGTRFVITNSKSELSRLSTSGSSKENSLSKLTEKNNMAMEASISPKYWPVVLKEAVETEMGYSGKIMYSFADLFDRMTLSGSVSKSEVKISMKNTDENSLYSICKFVITQASSIN